LADRSIRAAAEIFSLPHFFFLASAAPASTASTLTRICRPNFKTEPGGNLFLATSEYRLFRDFNPKYSHASETENHLRPGILNPTET
jgi:hypothetical protein